MVAWTAVGSAFRIFVRAAPLRAPTAFCVGPKTHAHINVDSAKEPVGIGGIRGGRADVDRSRD